jgi:hypothetical protein
MPETASSSLQYDTLCVRRLGLTRDLPPGAEDRQWVANTATLIFGGRDAVLVDTCLLSTLKTTSAFCFAVKLLRLPTAAASLIQETAAIIYQLR